MLRSGTGELLSQLDELRRTGVLLDIDDFGTGYSSLSYLARLPVHKLKIDRSLVEDMLDQPKNRAITHAIVALAHELHLTVVAEGVETAPLLAALETAHCDAVQGFHTGRPMRADELVAWVAARPARDVPHKVVQLASRQGPVTRTSGT